MEAKEINTTSQHQKIDSRMGGLPSAAVESKCS